MKSEDVTRKAEEVLRDYLTDGREYCPSCGDTVRLSDILAHAQTCSYLRDDVDPTPEFNNYQE